MRKLLYILSILLPLSGYCQHPCTPPTGSINPPLIFCAGQPITLTASANGGNPPFTYTWSTGQTGSSITINPGPDTTTTYTCVIKNSCGDSTVKTTTALPDNFNLYISNDTTINPGGQAYLHIRGAHKYQWIPDSGINCDTCQNIIATPGETTTYMVIGTDSEGCQKEKTITVTITPTGVRSIEKPLLKIMQVRYYTITGQLYGVFPQEQINLPEIPLIEEIIYENNLSYFRRIIHL